MLRQRYPGAKYILIDDGAAKSADGNNIAVLDALSGADVLRLQRDKKYGWRAICEHLKLSPPDAAYPTVRDIGQRKYQSGPVDSKIAASARPQLHDPSPWIAKSHADWVGINASALPAEESAASCRVSFEDDLEQIQLERWLLRNDTFPGNLALFRPANVTSAAAGGLSFAIKEEPLGVRNFSAAAISSHKNFLFGRFEVTLQATNVPGVVTGFFLHRNSPRQEIDIEIRGNQPNELLVNVFYNPGTEGAKFDYGYRGTPAIINLGFDASKALHRYTIEWNPCEIRWLVDQVLVHRRGIWDPTPIPNLPMTLHTNTWPTRSRELAGRLARRRLPATATVRRVVVDAFNADA